MSIEEHQLVLQETARDALTQLVADADGSIGVPGPGERLLFIVDERSKTDCPACPASSVASAYVLSEDAETAAENDSSSAGDGSISESESSGSSLESGDEQGAESTNGSKRH